MNSLFEPIVCVCCQETVYRMKGRLWTTCSSCRQKRGERTHVDWIGYSQAVESSDEIEKRKQTSRSAW
jgi:hypothetical protein